MTQIRLACLIVRLFARPLLAMALLISWLPGCATSEGSVQKSKGYYHEGLASLDKDQQKAFVSFQKAVNLDPNNKEARYGLGHILAMQGKLPQAEAEFRVATKLDESYSVAHTYLGQILEKQGRPSDGPLVPEPASLVIWGLGLGTLGLIGYRRRKLVN